MYWLARWPVTVAQFGQYLAESGRRPGDPDCLKAPANTPVVYCSWDEAMACADWLTDRWRTRGWLPAGWRVTLPSEPEWEKAAKGGFQVPAEGACLIRPVSEIVALATVEQPLTDNPDARRPYPWGAEPDPERMNVDMNIGQVSPAGFCCEGRSAYGCEDLAGNVLEWTRSRYDAYPYPEDAKGRAAREDRGWAGWAERVLRGGAFHFIRWNARVSYRLDRASGSRSNFVGFRLLLSPSFSL